MRVVYDHARYVVQSDGKDEPVFFAVLNGRKRAGNCESFLGLLGQSSNGEVE